MKSRQNQAEDSQRKELADAKNTADSAGLSGRTIIERPGRQTARRNREDVKAKINALRQSMNGEDLQNIRDLTSDLQNALNALSKQASTQSQPGSHPDNDAPEHREDPEGEVVEGEFKEV